MHHEAEHLFVITLILLTSLVQMNSIHDYNIQIHDYDIQIVVFFWSHMLVVTYDIDVVIR